MANQKKITDAQVRQIRRLIDDKAERLPEIEAEIEVLKAEKKKLKATQSYQAIANRYGVTKSCIQILINKYNRANVD